LDRVYIYICCLALQRRQFLSDNGKLVKAEVIQICIYMGVHRGEPSLRRLTRAGV
jgi:hypothetical protein